MKPNKFTENRFDEKHLGEMGFGKLIVYFCTIITILNNSNYNNAKIILNKNGVIYYDNEMFCVAINYV